MNQLDLSNRVAVITGGAQGIGYACAQRMLRSGAAVVLVGHRRQRGSNERAKVWRRSARSLPRCVELTDEAAVQDATQAALAAHRRIDILVNNAGITGGNAATWELDPAVWRRVIDVNLYRTVPDLPRDRAAHARARLWTHREHRFGGGQGRQSECRALQRFEGRPDRVDEVARQGARDARRARQRGDARPQRKTAIFDSMTQAHIDFMLSKIPMGRFLEVDEVAAMVSWLASEDCAFSTGAVFDISGGRATY